jgi:alkylhydroperoxidase/carboxymuconolactone decarboxylase family protein YurZ
MKKEEKELIKKIKSKRTWLLNFHKLLLANDPEMLEKWDTLYSTGKFKERFITAREKELVDLAISAIMKWKPGLEIDIKKALDLGITEKEVVEIFSLSAMSAGIPCMMFAADVYEEMKKNNFQFSFPQYKLEE